MSATVFVNPHLPWDPLPGENKRIRALMIFMLALAFLIMVVVPYVKVPEIKRSEAEAVPERLAKLVVEQKQVPPPPPKPKEETKPDENLAKKEEAKPTEEKEPKPVVTDLQRTAAKARASKAIQEAGIADALSDIRDMDVATMAKPTGLPGQTGNGTGGLITSTEAAGTSRNLLTSRAGSGSGGLAAAGYAGGVSSGFGGGVAGGKGSRGMLGGGGGGGLQTVKSGIEGAAVGPRPVGKDGKSRRTDEDIQKIFDRNISRLYAAYQRALRDDPNLQGTVNIKLAVAPDGSVTSCSIASSQLNNAELEAKIVALVKGFNFGADNVEPWSGSHIVNFSPQ